MKEERRKPISPVAPRGGWGAAASLLSSFFFLLSSAASADVVIITAENREIQAREIKLVTLQGELCVEYDGGHVIKCSDIVEIAFNKLTPRTKFAAADVVVTLSTGDVVNGTITAAPVADGFTVATVSLGAVPLVFTQLEGMGYLANRKDWPKKEPSWDRKSDLVVNVDLDLGTGTVLTIDPGKLTYFSKVGKREKTVQASDLAIVRFVVIEKEVPKAPAELYSILTTTDGCLIQGTITGLQNGVLQIKDLFGNVRNVPIGFVASLYFKNGRVVYLSDMKPVKVEEDANYVTAVSGRLPSDKVFPWHADKSANGTKLSIKGREFRKGIGVHAWSSLTYDLGGKFARFQASVGLDDSASFGDVAFEVYLDDKLVKTMRSKSGNPAVELDIEVAGAKQIRIVVDFADNAEVGDFADWGSARLIK